MRAAQSARPGDLVRLRPRAAAAPAVPLRSLDQLWFQVAGTVCNLRCGHCFISCAPENHSFWFLPLAEVRRHLESSVARGVKEYYFTGGEPFMNREIVEILSETLTRGPATVLTNGTLLGEKQLEVLASAEAASRYSLEFRVSIDGPDADTNDPVRGEGTFERAMGGVEALLRHGFLPIVTAAQVWEDREDAGMRARFMDALRSRGYVRPRLKILPRLRIGREALRSRGYSADEAVSVEMLAGFDVDQLICSSARVVTSRGVWVCPILLDAPDARLGGDLGEAERPFRLSHRACYTCWLHGAICSNFAGLGGE